MNCLECDKKLNRNNKTQLCRKHYALSDQYKKIRKEYLTNKKDRINARTRELYHIKRSKLNIIIKYCAMCDSKLSPKNITGYCLKHRKKSQYSIDQQKKYSEHTKMYRKEYYKKNKKKINENTKIYYQTNKEKMNQYSVDYVTERIKIDKLFALGLALRSRLRIALNSKNWRKTTKFSEYIGCSLKELELQFKDGMTWKNYGLYGWHIDHIVPLSSARTEEEIYKLCHYTNLQPLWAKENLSKGSKQC